MKNTEKKVYEFIGIKAFRKILLNLLYNILYIIEKLKGSKKEKSEILKEIKNVNTYGISNYSLKKGFNLQNLRTFKKALLFNTIVHTYAFFKLFKSWHQIITGSVSIENILFTTAFTILNTYCIILQRYNQIRINEVLKKWEPKEAKEKEELKEKILSESINNNISLQIKKPLMKKDITTEHFVKHATLEDLKTYRNFLISLKNNKQYLDSFQTEEYYTHILSLDKFGHSLKIKYKSKN